MNFLAHAYLSGNNKQVLLGNFIADSIKGTDLNNYSGDVRRGILMHREIDHYTDNHPLVKKGKERLYEKYHKYASVIIDMYYDHFLARNWHVYSDTTLEEYAQNVYVLLIKNYSLLPLRYKKILPFMIRSNWLCSYASIEGIGQRLTGLANYRARYISKMEESTKELEQHYELFQSEFEEFMFKIKKHLKKF